MLFNSYAFLFGFLPVCLTGYFLLAQFGGHRAGVVALAAASLFFYGWWNPGLLWVLLLSIGVNAALAYPLITRGYQGRLRTALFGAGLAFNLLLLGSFKYAAFVAANGNALLGTHWDTHPGVLPLGISFFTFQKIALLADAYAGKIASFNLLDYTLFVTFFPQLIAGPIVHHSELMPQIKTLAARPKGMDFAIGANLFAIGLFKKTVLADFSAIWAQGPFAAAAAGSALTPADAWVGALAYAFQIYFDFSGYSDMAIGLARLFGVRLPLNFYSPYQAASIIDFWHRWHMTLSRFLRDYIYIPLGGNRHGSGRRYANLLATMLIGGLWHGAAWTFVLWGGLHGVLLMINHGWRTISAKVVMAPRLAKVATLAATVLTFLSVVTAWVFFRSESLAAATRMLAAMYGWHHQHLVASLSSYLGAQWAMLQQLQLTQSSGLWLLIVGLVTFALPNCYEIFREYHPALTEKFLAVPAKPARLTWSPTNQWAAVMAILFVAGVLRLGELSPFIYFQF